MPVQLPPNSESAFIPAILQIIMQRIDTAMAQARAQLQNAERQAEIVRTTQAELDAESADQPEEAVLNADFSSQAAAALATQATLRLQMQQLETQANSLKTALTAAEQGNFDGAQAFLNAFEASTAELSESEEEEEDPDQQVVPQKRPRNI